MYLKEIPSQYSKDIPAKDIRLICQKILNISDTEWITQQNYNLNHTEQNMVDLVITKRQNGIPVARLFKEWEFWGLEFHLSDETLIPRPDTETIIDAVLQRYNQPPIKILDLGTGSGCILISLLTEYPDAFGVGVDLSHDALKTARKNAIRNNVFKRSQFIQSNWLDSIEGDFDLIVSNPPYIETEDIESLSKEVRENDPILALDGGADGLDSIRLILKKIKTCFTKNTLAFFEIGYNQSDSVMKLIEEFGFSTITLHKDLSGHKRVVEFCRGDNNKKNES